MSISSDFLRSKKFKLIYNMFGKWIDKRSRKNDSLDNLSQKYEIRKLYMLSKDQLVCTLIYFLNKFLDSTKLRRGKKCYFLKIDLK